jgi:hypothetical protein
LIKEQNDTTKVLDNIAIMFRVAFFSNDDSKFDNKNIAAEENKEGFFRYTNYFAYLTLIVYF